MMRWGECVEGSGPRRAGGWTASAVGAAVPEPVWLTGRLVCDADGLIVGVEPSLAGTLGYGPSDLTGLRGIDLIAPGDRAAVLAATNELHRGLRPALAVDLSFLTRTGGVMPAQVVLSPRSGAADPGSGAGRGLVCTALFAAPTAADHGGAFGQGDTFGPGGAADRSGSFGSGDHLPGPPRAASRPPAVQPSPNPSPLAREVATTGPSSPSLRVPAARRDDVLLRLVDAASAMAAAVQTLVAVAEEALGDEVASGDEPPHGAGPVTGVNGERGVDRPDARRPEINGDAGLGGARVGGSSGGSAAWEHAAAPLPARASAAPGDQSPHPRIGAVNGSASAPGDVDSLTGLATRGALLRAMSGVVAGTGHPRVSPGDGSAGRRTRGTEPATGCAVLLVDLDEFKTINDTHGHEIGDEVLIHVAQRLTACVRPDDLVVRFGGDEFVVLCRDAAAARSVAARIVALLAPPVDTSAGPVSITASVGISDDSIPFDEIGDLLTRADTAMYWAKELGKNRFFAYDQVLHDRAMHSLATRRLLQNAVQGNRVRVVYQPIMTTNGTGAIGVEAAARIVDDDGRTLKPADFLPIAERAGLIAAIDTAVLEESCRAIGDVMRRLDRPLAISVNVSGQFVGRGDLVQTVLGAIDAAGLPPAALMLEITEEALIGAGSAALARLAELRDRGVRIALDNFGEGFAALTFLRTLPLSHVKVDRPCIAGMVSDSRDAAMVEAVTWLVGRLGLAWIAEGVETDDEWRALKRFGPGLAQGYLFTEPLDVDGLVRGLRSGFGSVDRAAGDDLVRA